MRPPPGAGVLVYAGDDERSPADVQRQRERRRLGERNATGAELERHDRRGEAEPERQHDEDTDEGVVQGGQRVEVIDRTSRRLEPDEDSCGAGNGKQHERQHDLHPADPLVVSSRK